MGSNKIPKIVIALIIMVLFNQIAFCEVGDSITESKGIGYFTNISLEKAAKELKAFLQHYALSHKIKEYYFRNDKKIQGLGYVKSVSIKYSINNIYDVDFLLEQRQSFIDLIFNGNKQEKIQITITFNYFRHEDQAMDCDIVFQDFINEFRNYMKKNHIKIKL